MKALLLIFTITTAINLNAQNVKYKDGKVLVDKEHKFDFNQIAKDDDNTDLKQYALTDLDGNVVLSLTDTAFYFEQLPNEQSSRKAFEAYALTAPSLSLTAVMPYYPIMNYPKQRINDLKKIGFFEDLVLNQDRYNEFLKKQNPESLEKRYEELTASNINRKANYKITEEKIGPLLARKPGKISVTININTKNGYNISDGKKIIGEFVITDKDSYKPGVRVMKSDGEQIAQGEIYRDPETEMGLSQYKYSLKLYARGMNNLEENFKWFYVRAKSQGTQESTTDKLINMANYLVNEGFL